MSAVNVTPIKGRVMRTMKLDVCGNPVTGTGNVVVDDGFIMVHPTPQYEDGTEFTQKRADGVLCVNQKDPGQLKRVSAETTWCVLSPDTIVLQTGSREILTSATGTGAIFSEGLITARFSLEVWQMVTGRNACDANGVQRYVYWAWPNMGNAQISDFQIENNPLQWKMTAETQSAGVLWGSLPTVLPPSTYLSGSSFVPGDHYGYNVVTTAPPAATVGAGSLT